MNAQDRKKLLGYVEAVQALSENIRHMSEDEQEKFENMTEGLQQTEQGEEISEAATQLRADSR